VTIEGLDLGALDSHFRSVGVARRGELRAELIAGGRSNLTFLVFDDASKWVLRRPPLHGLTPSAHDVAREYRVVAALANTSVPVAPAITMRNDDSPLGTPFAVVEFVPGRVIRTQGELEALGQDAIDGCVDTLIRVLTELHAVDPAAVGLSDFGRPDGYLERQVRRWGGQWQYVRLSEDARDGDVHRLHAALVEAVPAQSRTSIVHGDYRIDNTIIDGDDPSIVRAVVDWEMSTLGDPLSDTALMCVYRDRAMDMIVDQQAAWTSPLLPSADELAHRYSVVSEQPLAHWPFYMSLAYFKLAIIAAGIDYRRRMGAGQPDSYDRVGETVAPLIAAGLHALKAG
jgi:aminoglycoside phosphotransferase (APT) family kinase protein